MDKIIAEVTQLNAIDFKVVQVERTTTDGFDYTFDFNFE